MTTTVKTDANGRLVAKTFTTDDELIAELLAQLQEAYAEVDRLRAELQKQEAR